MPSQAPRLHLEVSVGTTCPAARRATAAAAEARTAAAASASRLAAAAAADATAAALAPLPHALRAASLFCGGGGSSLGLAAHFKVVLGVDTNRAARRCFLRNHPGAVARSLSVHDVERCAKAILDARVQLADCSAPCKGWSPAGHQRPLDPRNALTVSAAKVFGITRTPVVIFENVTQAVGKEEWERAMRLLRRADYHVSIRTLNAEWFGVPMHRRRVFAVCTQPGYKFDFGASVDQYSADAASRPRPCINDVMPDVSALYYLGRGRRDPCVVSAALPAPSFRCNCAYYPKRHRRRERDVDSFSQTREPTVHELKQLIGWPADAYVPERRSAAGKILGNSVAPPVTRWIGGLAASAIRDALAVSDASAAAASAVARLAAAIKSPADLKFFQAAAAAGWGEHAGPAAMGWGSSGVQRLLDARDRAVPGAHVGPLPGTDDPQQLRIHCAVPDPEASYGQMHRAQMQRRERRRLAILLQSHIASDGTLRSLDDPIWSAPPVGAPPSSGNPAAHWAAKPYRIAEVLGVADTSVLPTHPTSTVSKQYRRFRAMHMAHCHRCAEHSTAVHGRPPPLAALRCAHVTGVIPDCNSWTLDPGCYQAEMIEEIRIGHSPPLDPAPPPDEYSPGATCWDNWETTIEYLDKMESIVMFGPGVWRKPDDAVVSAMHMVMRASDIRASARDGSPTPVRSVTDCTRSKINDGLPRWPFRMPNVDDAVALTAGFENSGGAFLGTTDLSKFFPSLGLGPQLRKVMWVRDPRASTTWQGSGPPSAAWLAWQAERRRSGKRYPPYRPCWGVPLGIRTAPAFACGISGEIVCFLTALGLRCSMYVDDAIMAGLTAADVLRDMHTASSVFRWLGLRCNADKMTGPSRCIKYLGFWIDTVQRCVSIDTERRLAYLADVQRLIDSDAVCTKDLETTIGKLSYAAQVVRGGSAYLQRLRLLLSSALRSSSSTVAMCASALADCTWWHARLSSPVSGSRVFSSTAPLPVVTFKADASGVHGWGYVLDGVLHWSKWHDSSIGTTHMQYKECVAILHCMREYGTSFSGSIVRFGCDNAGTCFAVNKLTSRCPTLMHLLRELADTQCAHDADVIACHVSRQFNTLADLCSRFTQLAEFASFLPPDVAPLGDGQVRLCRAASPADNEPVYRLDLRLLSKDASCQPPPPPTAAVCGSSSTSAISWVSPGSSSTTRSPGSTPGTSPASGPRTSSCGPGPPSPSSARPSPTTRCSTLSTGQGGAQCAASTSTTAACRTSTRTRSSATLSSASPPFAPSAPCSASTTPGASRLAQASSTWSSGPASSSPTRPCSAPSRTRAACKSKTSRSPGPVSAAQSSPSWLSAGGGASASSSTSHAASRCRSTCPTCPLGTSSVCSTAGFTAAAAPARRSSLTSATRPPAVMASACRGPLTGHTSSGSAAGPASAAQSLAAVCAPVAPPTSSLSVRLASTSSTKAAGAPALSSPDTTGRRPRPVSSSPRGSPLAFVPSSREASRAVGGGLGRPPLHTTQETQADGGRYQRLPRLNAAQFSTLHQVGTPAPGPSDMAQALPPTPRPLADGVGVHPLAPGPSNGALAPTLGGPISQMRPLSGPTIPRC